MTDATGDNTSTHTNADDPNSNKEAGKVIFTPEQQEAVNKIIADRLEQERKAQERKEAERQKKAEIEKLSGEEKLKAEHKAEVDKILAERDEAVKANRMLKAGEELAKLGYDTTLAKYVVDEDDKVTTENVKALDRMINAIVEKRVQENLSRGAPKSSGQGAPTSMLDEMRKVAGIKLSQ